MAIRKFFHAIIPDIPEKSSDINETAKINIERIAIDQRGCLGSIYDGYTDNIKGKLNANDKSRIRKLTNQTKCRLTQGRKPETHNLLKFVDIDDQLRLSVALKMVPATGIASLVRYSRLIDKYTRLLYVCHESYIKSCGDSLHELKKSIRKSTCETYGSHIITGIVHGVHLLVILQLPPALEEDIDILLWKTYPSLSNFDKAIKMNSEDRGLLNHIISTDVYSNIDDLTKLKKFEHVYDRIIDLQKNDNEYRPLKYILTPIRWFYGEHGASIPRLILHKPNDIETIEHYLIQQSSEFKVMMLRINRDLSEMLQGTFKKQLENIQEELSTLRILQDNDIEQIRHLIWEIRQGEVHKGTGNNRISLDPPKEIQRLINNINIHTEELESKGKLIKLLQSDNLEYCDVAQLGIREGLTEERAKEMLFGNDSNKAMFFSTDTFRKEDQQGWAKLYSEMIEERRKNLQVNLVYADFTDSAYKLKKMEIVRSPENTVNYDQSNSKPSQINFKSQISLQPPSSSTNECINILLLGESGVGKSTFINAFANYLCFRSLEEAQQGKPVVIIPTSFVMTINDNFDERVIKFGEADPNENHNDFGQSVTQQCKSYVFNIFNDKKLRIIDTPGFGDTRGDQQDDLNMEEIFSFLNNFTYLNGICLLFKPEVAQLNRYFRSCCTQLFDYFGNNIRDHLIFCFTNTRSTFFAPGNTRPLLQTFFESFPVKGIPFEKENTFSFDSESFRYLVALQHSIELDQNQRGEFEKSWLRSVTESKRFREFLCNQNAYHKNDEWQSIKDAQFQINYMIRPMLEATRNLLRNWLLSQKNSFIKLRAVYTEPSSMICYTCTRNNPVKIGQFWILPDHLHYSPNTCPSNEQKPAEYRLHYQFFNNQVDESIDDLNKQLKLLCDASTKFTSFLMKTSQALQNNPFLTGADRMINEEQFICQTQTSTDANKMLIDRLKQFKIGHEEHLNTIKFGREELTLPKIYDLIQSMDEIRMVKIQLDAIREYQQRLVKNNQRVVT